MRQEEREGVYDNDMENSLFDIAYITECFENGTYDIVELAILKSLYKYVFLDKKTLHESVNCYLKPSLRKPDYEKNIHNMNGVAISKIHYTEGSYDGKKTAEIAVYHLTIPAHNFIKKKYPKYKVPICSMIKKPPLGMYDESYIKERLMINRWHLYMLTQHNVTKDIYCSKKRFTAGRISIPSCVCLSKSITVIAIAYPREGIAYEQKRKRLKEKIKEIKRVVTYSLKPQILIVLLCHVMNDIEAACEYLGEVGQGIAYVTEADIVKKQGMKRLYGCEILEDGKIEKKFMNMAFKGDDSGNEAI